MSFQHMVGSLCPAFLTPTRPHRQQLVPLMFVQGFTRLLERPGSAAEPLENNPFANYSNSNLHLWIISFLTCTGLFACSFLFLLLTNPCRIFMVSGVSIWEERLFPSIQFLLPLTFVMLQIPGAM